MTLFPVIERELRVAARRPFTYWGRVAAGLVAMGVIGWLMLVERGGTSQAVGRQLFGVGATFAFLFALVAGPSFTADSISGERREGTLGLLFLTDLKGRDIAVGKLLATSLGCASYLMAAVPVLGVALLLGGVGAGEGLRVVLVLANTLLFSLSAGLLASTLSTTSRGASGVASLLVLGGAGGVPAMGMLLLWVFGQWDGSSEMAEWWMEHVFLPPCAAAPMATAFEGAYRAAPGPSTFLVGTAFTHILTWVFFGLTAWRLPRIWQDTGRERGGRPAGMAAAGGADPEVSVQRGRCLDLSPFVWLAERWPWRRRLVWVFLAGVAVVFVTLGLVFGSDWLDAPGYFATSLVLHLVLKYWIASEAPRQFFEDRRNGAMELLLGTSMTVSEIVRGRFLALERQFLGPLLAVTAADVAALFASLVHWDNDSGEWMMMWLARMVILWADAVALAWTGMWIGLVGHGNRTTGAAFARVVLLPWLVVFVSGTFLGLTRSLNQWGFAGFLVAWLLLNLGNAGFWIGWARNALHGEFRERATLRPGERRHRSAAPGATAGSAVAG